MLRHVLCVYPYREELGPLNLFYPPLGLEIIAAVLKPHCQAIDVVDLRRESGRTRDFLRPDTDLVCFSVNWDSDREFVLEEVRSVPQHIRTILGGRHATLDPEAWLSDCPNVDILARGEGEEAIKEITEDRPLDGIAGISYRLNGRVAHNPVRRSGPVRDDFRPDRSLRRYSYTIDVPGLRTDLTFDTVASSSGCPFNCKFCAFNRNPWGEKRSWSARSPESVVSEIGEIDAEVVGFVDDLFTHDMDRVAAICDLLQERGIRKRYVANARIEIAKRPDVLKKMERAGFAILLLGIESAQDKTLRSMQKGFNTKQMREYFRVLRKTRILLHGYFIVGNIGESEEEMLQITPFARELGVDTVTLNLLRNECYSGLEQLVLDSPGYHIAPDGKVFSDRYSAEHLAGLLDRIYGDFYSPGQMLRILRRTVRNGIFTPRMLLGLPALLLHATAGSFNPVRG